MSGSIQNRRIKVKILVLSLLASFFSMGISQNANASEGAGVWAVVDSSGTVTNVIVCTQSVCGGGTFGGERVVPQIAPNPITNNAEGQGSFIGNESAGIRVTESNGIFTVHENVRINSTEIEVTVNDKAKTTTISEVSIPVTSRSFSYNDTIGKTYSEIKLKNESYDDERPTNILVKQKTSKLLSSETLSSETLSSETLSSETLSSELISIVGRKTASELEIILIQNQLDLIRSKIDNLIKMLGGWIKP